MSREGTSAHAAERAELFRALATTEQTRERAPKQ